LEDWLLARNDKEYVMPAMTKGVRPLARNDKEYAMSAMTALDKISLRILNYLK